MHRLRVVIPPELCVMNKYRFRFSNKGYYTEYHPGDVVMFWVDDLKTGESHLLGYYKNKKVYWGDRRAWKIYIFTECLNRLASFI